MARILLISFLFIILPIAAYSQNLPLSNPVLDNNGDPVVTGVDYVIDVLRIVPGISLLPPSTVGLSSAPNHTCPLDVVLKGIGSKALPVKFSSVDSTKDNQTVNTFIDTNIVFSASTVCVTSTVWTIKPSTVNGTITFFVEIGGVKGAPDNLFNIQPGKRVLRGAPNYVINFCPRVCSGCERPAACGNIGVIVDDDGRSRLGVTSGEPLYVFFTKP